MNVEFVGHNGDVPASGREHASKKVEKALKFLEEPIEARFTFDLDRHRHVVELHVAHRHGTLQAHGEAETWIDAINGVVERLERQAVRGKQRFLDRRRREQRNGHAWPVDVVDKGSLAADSPPRVIKSSLIQIKPMRLEEAALQLEGSEHGFVVFRDAETDEVNVLFKRKDHNYGLIAPNA